MCEQAEREPRIAIGVDMKINLGNYESLGCSVMVSGLRPDATRADIGELLNTSEMAFNVIKQRMESRLAQEREARRKPVTNLR